MTNFWFLFFVGILSEHEFHSSHNPQLQWKTLETENFYIHHTEEQTWIADRLAIIAESVHERLSEEMRWTASRRTHVVLDPRPVSPGGFASPIPYNIIYLNPVLPPAGGAIDDYDDWLTLLFTHEYTHTLHIDMVGGFNRILRGIFGRAWVPNAVQPQWLVEGLAMKHETDFTTKGRGQSSYVNMHLRAATLEDRFATIDRATYWNDVYPFANVAYWYGVAFHHHLEERYGESFWIDYAHVNARWPLFGFLNFKVSRVADRSFHQLWVEWKSEQENLWRGLVEKFPSQYEGEALVDDYRLLQAPQIWNSSDGPYVIGHFSKNDQVGLYKIPLHLAADDSSERKEPELLQDRFRGELLHVDDNTLYFSRVHSLNRYSGSHDLVRMNLETKKTERLTKGAFIPQAAIHESSVVGIRQGQMQYDIVRFEIPDDVDQLPLSGDRFEVLYSAPQLNQVGMPALSPNGQELVFSMQEHQGCRNLFQLSLRTKELQQLTFDCRLHYHPHWDESGKFLYFVSDQDLKGSGQSVFNLFEMNMTSKQITQVTDTWNGVHWPKKIGEEMIVGHYSATGFELHRTALLSADQRELSSQRVPMEERSRVPPVLKDANEDLEAERRPFSVGSEIFPQYLLPIWYLGDDSSILGVTTGSQDPIGRHAWNAFGYYYWQARRPGGGFSYRYRGLGHSTLHLSSFAGISRIGPIYIRKNPVEGISFRLPDSYYERSLSVTLSISHQPWLGESQLPLRFSGGFFFEHRRPLLPIPDDAIQTESELSEHYPGAVGQVLPEKGNQFGFFTGLNWFLGMRSHPRGISPLRGHTGQLGIRYAPKWVGSDFESLSTSLSTRAYVGTETHGLAVRAQIAIQWLDALYQSTFRLGGSAGEGDLPSLRVRTYPLRGLGVGELRGEGVLSSSIEYRLRLLSAIPGWGTAPIWFKNLHAAFFSDVGQAFQHQDPVSAIDFNPAQNFSLHRMSLSLGAELRSHISVYYAPPINFRLGYAQIMLYQGSDYWTTDKKQVYFQIGQSF